MYIVASLACALAEGVVSLIIWRSLQAIGAASATVIALVLTKDLFNGQQREKVLAYISMIMALAPILSPIIGAYLLMFINWQAIFICQALLGIPALLGSIRVEETNKVKAKIKIIDIFSGFSQLFANEQFRRFNFLQALSMMPMFGFIAASPTIYIEYFGVSEEEYGYLFALNAFAVMLGAFIFSRTCSRINNKWVLLVGILGQLLGGLFLLADFNLSMWVNFTAPLFMVAFCIGLTRAIMNNYALEVVQEQAGTASSLLSFSAFFGAMLAMQWVVLQELGSPIWLLTLLVLAISVGCLLLWWAITDSMQFDLQTA